MNNAHYKSIIPNYWLLRIEAHDLDGASCHTVRETMPLLKEQFDEQLIFCFKPLNFPYLTKVFMVSVGNDILPLEILDCIIDNWNYRMYHVRRRYNKHLKEIIFKTLIIMNGFFCKIIKI